MKDQTTSDCVRMLKQIAAIEPSPEVMQSALERTRETLDSLNPTTQALQVDLRRSGRGLMRFATSIAAVLLVAVGGAYLVFFAPSGATSAFAQVQSAIKEVFYISFSVKVLESPKNVVAKSGESFVDVNRNRYRFESADGEDIQVIDGKHSVCMTLYPNQKRAFVSQYPPLELPSFMKFLYSLRDCDTDFVEQLEDADFAGRRVERYRILPEAPISGGIELFVSADPKTRLPVRIQYKTDLYGGLLCVEYNNFSFAEIDPTLFETIPPQDYHNDGPVGLTPQSVALTREDVGSSSVNVEPQAAELTTLLEKPMEPNLGPLPISKSVRFEIYNASATSTPNGATCTDPNDGSQIYVANPPIVSSSDVATVEFTPELENDYSASLLFVFNVTGGNKLLKATAASTGSKLVVMVDGVVLAAPKIVAPINHQMRLSGGRMQSEGHDVFRELTETNPTKD